MNKIVSELEQIVGFEVEEIDNINFNTISSNSKFDIIEFNEIYHEKSAGVRNAIVLYKNKILRNRSIEEILEFKTRLTTALEEDNLINIVDVLKEMFLISFITDSHLKKLEAIYKEDMIDGMFNYYINNRIHLSRLLKHTNHYN